MYAIPTDQLTLAQAEWLGRRGVDVIIDGDARTARGVMSSQHPLGQMFREVLREEKAA